MRTITTIFAFIFLALSNIVAQSFETANVRSTAIGSIPSDNTLRYYRLAIPVTRTAYEEDLGENYNNVLQFWRDCEEFANRMFVPLGICFDVVEDQRLVKTDYFTYEENVYTLQANGTTNTNDLIGADSYDVAMWVHHRDVSAENSGLSVEGGVYNSSTKGSGYSKTDKWVVAHELGHMFGAPHTTTGEGSLMDSGGDDFFSYPSIKKIRDLAVERGASSANKAVNVSNSAPVFNNANMKDSYRIPQGACIAIPVYANDTDGNMLTYSAIGCSSSTVGNVVEGGVMPHFASLIPQTSNVIDYRPKFTADIFYDDFYYEKNGTNIPEMSAGSYDIAILVNDVPSDTEYDYLDSNPFYSNYAVWDATVQIVGGTAFNASMSPAKNSYSAGEQVTVSWGVNSNYFTADSRLRITMSTDYGKTFAYVLADNVPALDGNKVVTLPDINVGNIDVDFKTATRSMRGGIIRVEEVGGVAYTLTTLSPMDGKGFNITGGSGAPITYTISVTAGDGGTATIGGKSSTTVDAGSSVTLTATPYDGYIFDGWYSGGSFVSLQAEYTFIPTASGTYNALFEEEAGTPVTYEITATANPIEGGTVTGGGTYNEGATVTLTATPNSGYTFVNWTNGGKEVTTQADCTINNVTADADYVANFEPEVQDELTTGYYHLVSRATDRNEHLYNNAFSSDNTYHFTLQSNTMVNTNNGIWYITKNGNQLGIKNGDGKPVVAGDSYKSIMGTFSNLNIHTTINDAGDGYTYYYFNEALNCSKSDQDHFKVGGINFLTTWSGYPNATDNQWRFERVDTEGKNIYNVVVECTENDVYVTYGSEYAFDGGFFITDATITAQQLTANKNNAAVQDVTVLVEGSTIRVVDTEYVDITVSTTPAEGGSVTINDEATGTKRVIKGSEVTLAANANNGYNFTGWYNGENKVYEYTEYTFTATDAVSLTARFEQVPTYTITVSASPAEGGTVTGGGTYNEGATVTLTATPNSGYEFVNWTNGGKEVTTQADYIIYNVAGDAEYVANFKEDGSGSDPQPPTGLGGKWYRIKDNASGKYIDINKDGKTDNSHGNVIMSDKDEDSKRQIIYFETSGDGYKLKAATGDYIKCEQWNVSAGDANSAATLIFEETGDLYYIKWNHTSYQNNIYYFKVENAKGGDYALHPYDDAASTSIAAKWKLEEVKYTISVSASEGGTAEVATGGGGGAASVEVPYDGSATLTATPASGFKFVNWTKGGTPFSEEAELTVNNIQANAEYVANFEEATDIVTNYTVTLTTTGIDNSKFAVFIYTGSTQDETTKSYEAGSLVKVIAAPDNEGVGSEGYLFVGWYNGEVCVSTDTEYEFIINENITLEAHFEKGCRVSVKTTNAYATIYDSKENAGTGSLLVKSGEVVRLTATPKYEGYRIIWKDNSENIVHRGTEFFQTVTEDITFTAIAEVAIYTLTVSTEGTNGTVQAKSGTMDPGTAIEVGYNMTATITATPASGYIFDRWTKNEEFVSDDATYTVPAINDVYAMVDVEYVAHFVEAPEAEAGKYYRIAYDFPVTAAAEPETVRYYMQSETCGVPEKTNALLMNEKTGASSIFYYADNNLLSYSKGTYVKEDSNARGLQGVGDAGGDVKILSYGETSTIAAPYYMHANINEGTSKTYFVDRCSSDNGDAQHNFIVEEVTALPVTISAAGQATFYAPVALEIPDDLKVYVLKEKNISTESYATMTRLTSIIPANTGVIIKGTQGNYNFNIVEENDKAIAEAEAEAEGNVFEGTVAATYVNKDAYILANRNGVVGLFPLSNNSYITSGETATFKNNSHKAYLPVEGNFGELLKKSNGFRFIFDDSIATVIDEMKTENGNDKTIYDLQGRKLSEITEPGIYIINGKKVFVK